MAVNSSKWGAKIGPRVAMLVSQSMVYTHSKLAGLKHKIAMSVFHAISDEISNEVDTTLGPLMARLHAETPEDHPAYAAIHFLHTATGQLKALAGTGLQVSGLLGAVSAVMNNDLLPVVYNLISNNPATIPDFGTISSLYAAGLIDENNAVGSMAKLGFDPQWSEPILQIARAWPDMSLGLELFRRNLISHDEFVTYMKLNGTPDSLAPLILKLADEPVSVADAALGVLRGDLTMDEGLAIAAENGFTQDSFNTLIANTGEPPGTEQMLEAFRRGFVDEATLDRAILQSRVRNEWIPVIKKLRYTPMSVADAVNAVVQGHMPMATGEQIANFNGLEPGDFDTLYQTAGEPLSRTELEQLYNRGLIDQAAVEQGLRESRLKDKYVTPAFDLHQKIVPVNNLQRALRYAGISVQDAIRVAMENGYSEQDATLIVKAGSAERLQTYKDRVVAAALAMYEDNVVSQADVTSLIESLDYTAEEAQFIFRSSEYRRNAHLINQVVSALKTKYLQRHISETQVINDLNAIGVPTSQRDQLMQLWNIERGAFTKILTEAQIVKAATDSLITEEDAKARLVNLGYNPADAELLLKGA